MGTTPDSELLLPLGSRHFASSEAWLQALSAVEARGVVPQYNLVAAINGVALRGYLDADVVVHLHVALGSGAKNARRVQLEDEPGLNPSERAARGSGLASPCSVNFIVTLRPSAEELLSHLPLGRAIRHNY